MRKLIAFLITVSSFLVLSLSAEASVQEKTVGDYRAVIFDLDDSLSEGGETTALYSLSPAVDKANMNVGVVFTDDVEGKYAAEYAAEFYNENFGENTDGVLLLINNETYFNWIYTNGTALSMYMEHADEMMENFSDHFINQLYVNIIISFSDDLIRYADEYYEINGEAITEEVTSTEPEAYEPVTNNEETEAETTVVIPQEEGVYTVSIGNNIALLHDLDNSLTEDEELKLINLIAETSDKIDSSVAVVITDDIGYDKSDYGVMDFADVYYENYCGMNTDGILLLINNDNKYDWISTSGDCIWRYEYDIDPIFDDFYDYLKDGDYYSAVSAYCNSVAYYYNSNASYDSSYDDYDYNYSYSVNIDGLFTVIVFAIIFTTIVLAVFFGVVLNGYRLNKNKSVATYELKDSLVLTQKSDTYLRTYTTRTRVNSSSSGGSGRSGGSHRSSGGGRHGGGGRRR